MKAIRRKLTRWWMDLPTLHHRILASYLRKRGWIVLWRPAVDNVNPDCRFFCALKQYDRFNK